MLAGPPRWNTAPDLGGDRERDGRADRFAGVVPVPPADESASFWSFGGPPRAARRRRFVDDYEKP